MSRPRTYTVEEARRRQIIQHIESKKRLNKQIQEAKLERGCNKCGYNEHPDALQFDHIEPCRVATRGRPRYDKSMKVLRVESYKALKAVLADHNVQVLCGNCHNIKSITERRKHKHE